MRLRTESFAAIGSAVLVAAAVLASHPQPASAAAAPKPYAAALAGHPFVSQVVPAAMTTARWDDP
jgi:hypothetical protein